MNAAALRRYAAHMYPILTLREQTTITARPQPGNELRLSLDAAGVYRLTLRREEQPIDIADATAVASAFVVPDNIEPFFEWRTERRTNRDVAVYYVHWTWIERA